MFQRILPFLNPDSLLKEARAMIDALPGQTLIVALDNLYEALGDVLAASPSGPAARRWLELLTPIAFEHAERVLAQLAAGADNPTRRDILAKRLHMLAEQIANASYIEALRASASLQKGDGRANDLIEWSTQHFRWLGLAHTAKGMLDNGRPGISWDQPVSLFLSLCRYGLVSCESRAAVDEPVRSLAYLLLMHDAVKALPPMDIAAASVCCKQFARDVQIGADFTPSTPLVMDVAGGDASRIVGWGGPSPSSPALCYGLEDVAAEARSALALACVGQAQPWLADLPRPVAVLEMLLQVWIDRRGRCRNPVVQRLQDAQVAFDFLRIRGLLAQKTERRLSNDPYIRHAEIYDIDDAGLSLYLSPDVAELMASGLLAFNIASRGWWLARPVRVLTDFDGRLFVAARWMGQRTESIRLMPQNGDNQRAVYIKADPSNGYQASILLDHDWLLVGSPCRADLAEASLTLIMAAPIQLGPSLWRYVCQVQ